MIVVGDIHLQESSEAIVFDDVLPGLQEAVERDPDRTLAILGDFYHIRYRVSVALQNRVLAFLEQLTALNIKVILLPGNHDQINPKGENALEVFRKIQNVRVYTDPTIDSWGQWVPYRKDLATLEYFVDPVSKDLPMPVLWLHHEVRGALMNNTKLDTTGFPLEKLKFWTWVICGHYHKRQQLGNVLYIGSAYQTRADEAGQDKGYGIWNSKKLELSWVNTRWGKRYHNIVVEADGGINLNDASGGDAIQVTVPAGMDPREVGQHLAERGFANVTVSEAVQTSGARLDVQSGAGVDQYAKAYVDQFCDKLQPERLMQLYVEIAEGK